MKTTEDLHCLWIATEHVSGHEEDWKRIYGADIVVSQVGQFKMLHLDCPKPAEVELRHESFDPGKLFRQDCPLCVALRCYSDESRGS